MNLQFQIQQWLEKRNNIDSHRQLVVISGEQSWAIEHAEGLLEDVSAHSPDDSLWVGYRNLQTETPHCADYRQHLGQQRSILIYNCYSGLRANALMAYSGSIAAHGLMVLLCPDFELWPEYADPQAEKRRSFGYLQHTTDSLFTRWLIQNIKAEPTTYVITQAGVTGQCALAAQHTSTRYLNATTPEQSVAVEQIVHSAFGHRHRPLVITADRGRGKSSALGLAAAALINLHQKKIIVSAPTVQNVEQVFAHSGQQYSPGGHKTDKGYLRFVPPDVLLRETFSADILFIDEAAAIPSPILKQLLNQFPRVVMCTTIHGYEGGGRGFELKFKPYLDQAKAGWQHIHLTMPIRWYQNDPLERFWFNVMLMQEERQQPSLWGKTPSAVTCRLVDKKQLLATPDKLFEIFNLLVNAHYQTTPDDLVRLLDAIELSLYILEHNGRVLAVALLVDEGGSTLDPLADHITAGQRRVPGHLVAQNLALHTADSRFCHLHQRRVQRIAVHHQHRQSGLGSLLLQAIVKDAKQDHVDMLSSSFGATSELLYFWQANNFSPCKLGYKRDAASGEHSVIVCQPLTPTAIDTLAGLHRQFAQELIFHSSRYYQDLDSNLLCCLFNGIAFDLTFSALEQALLQQYLAATRPYGSCLRVISKYYVHTLSQGPLSKQSSADEQLLMALLVQNKTESQICQLFLLTGKKELQRRILMAMRSIL